MAVPPPGAGTSGSQATLRHAGASRPHCCNAEVRFALHLQDSRNATRIRFPPLSPGMPSPCSLLQGRTATDDTSRALMSWQLVENSGVGQSEWSGGPGVEHAAPGLRLASLAHMRIPDVALSRSGFYSADVPHDQPVVVKPVLASSSRSNPPRKPWPVLSNISVAPIGVWPCLLVRVC